MAVDQTSNVGSHDDAQGQDVQPALEQVAGGASGFSTPPVDPRTDILGDEAQGQDVDVVDADQSGEPAVQLGNHRGAVWSGGLVDQGIPPQKRSGERDSRRRCLCRVVGRDPADPWP